LVPNQSETHVSEVGIACTEADSLCVPKFPAVSEDAMKVAIIMRTKDRPILLSRAVNSVILQRYSLWHIFLVNDGGDSETIKEVLAPFEAKLKDKITLFEQREPLGRAGAANVAIRAVLDKWQANRTSEGEKGGFAFFAIHDDDDTWHPDFLYETVAFLTNKNNDSFAAVGTRVALVREEIKNGVLWTVQILPYMQYLREINYHAMFVGNQGPNIAFLFRINALAVTGEFNEHFPLLSDWDFLIRLQKKFDIGFINKELASFHQRVKERTPNTSPYANGCLGESELLAKERRQYDAAVYRSALNEEVFQGGEKSSFPIFYIMANMEQRIRNAIDRLANPERQRQLERELAAKNALLEQRERELAETRAREQRYHRMTKDPIITLYRKIRRTLGTWNY